MGLMALGPFYLLSLCFQTSTCSNTSPTMCTWTTVKCLIWAGLSLCCHWAASSSVFFHVEDNKHNAGKLAFISHEMELLNSPSSTSARPCRSCRSAALSSCRELMRLLWLIISSTSDYNRMNVTPDIEFMQLCRTFSLFKSLKLCQQSVNTDPSNAWF